LLETVRHKGDGRCPQTLQLCARNGFALTKWKNQGDGARGFLGKDAGVGLTIRSLGLVENVIWVDLPVGNEEMKQKGVGGLIPKTSKVRAHGVPDITETMARCAGSLKYRFSSRNIGGEGENLLVV
jgi:hypothetical protein